MVSPGRVRRGQGDQESYISAGVPSGRWGPGGVRALTTQHFIFQCPPPSTSCPDPPPGPALPAPFASLAVLAALAALASLAPVVFPGAWAGSSFTNY